MHFKFYQMNSQGNKLKDRRLFIINIVKTGIAIGFMPLINACTKGGLSPFLPYQIDPGLCNGCGECVPYCRPDAILLAQKSTYSIDNEWCIDCGKCSTSCSYNAIKINSKIYLINIEKCSECGKCEVVCPQNAIRVSTPIYTIKEDSCIGCGDCVDVCKTEGNCISYEKEEYSVRSKCQNKECNDECVAACPEGAITTINGLAHIDMDKCTFCGKCVPVCPHDAINPAKVQLDQTNCTHCGKCYSACTFDAIEKTGDENYHEPSIDQNLCDGCADCLPVCPDGALEFIYKDENAPFSYINQDLCTACGDCYEKCPDGIDGLVRHLETAEILEEKCIICGDCVEICRFDAINKLL